MAPVRIGILMTNPDREAAKQELLRFSKDEPFNVPWNKADVPDNFIIRRKSHKDISPRGIPTDMALSAFIRGQRQWKGKVEVDAILPEEVSLARLKSNDINFLLIYDLLEAFHLDNANIKKTNYDAMKLCLKQAGNIYPPLDYQELFYSKAKYYKYLKEKNVSIIPGFSMSAHQYRALGHDEALKKVVKQARAEEWDSFITKPEFGQESKSCKIFTPYGNQGKFSKHLKFIFNKYPGMTIQKTIKHFGNSIKCPEVRMYFCGDTYGYGISSTNTTRVTPKEEGGKFNLPDYNGLKRFAHSVVRKLPTVTMPNGVQLPRLISRVDMGVLQNGKYKPWVNEIEFVPSLYCEDVGEKLVTKYVTNIGKSMVNIARAYVQGSARARRKSATLRQQRRAGVQKKNHADLTPAKVKRKTAAKGATAGAKRRRVA